MAKVTYRGQVFTGVLVDESNTHFTIEIDGDQVSFEKELTTIENEAVAVKGNRERKQTAGTVITTKSGFFYDVITTGKNQVRVDKYNKETFFRKSWFTVDTKTGKGGAGLPASVMAAIIG